MATRVGMKQQTVRKPEPVKEQAPEMPVEQSKKKRPAKRKKSE